MRFVCDSCRAQYMISDEKVGAKGVKVRCKKCGYVILVRKTQDVAAAPVPPPAPSDEGADATQVMQNPLATDGTGALPPVDPEITSPGVSANTVNGSSNSVLAGIADDEIGAVFDQVLASGSHKIPGASESEEGSAGLGLGDDDNDDRLSTRVLDAEVVRKLAQETAGEAPVNGNGVHANGKNGTAPKAEPAKHDWFVAIDDKQVGPLSLEKIKEHWDHGEIGPDSLCWRAGFSDWIPLSDVDELGPVLAPQPKKPVIVGSAPVEPPLGGIVGVPVESSFSVGGVTRTVRSEVPMMAGAPGVEEDVGWKPSAASALASLVKEEIEALAKPAAPAKPKVEEAAPKAAKPVVHGLLDLPSAEHSIPKDLLDEGAKRAPVAAPTPAPAPAGVPLGAPAQPYGPTPYATSVYQAPQKSNKALYAIGGVVVVLLLVVTAGLVYVLTKEDKVAEPAQIAQPVQVAQNTAPPPVQPPPAPVAKVEEPAKAPETQPATAAAAETEVKPAAEEKKEEPKQVARAETPKREEPRRERSTTTERRTTTSEKQEVVAKREEPAKAVDVPTGDTDDEFAAMFGGSKSTKSTPKEQPKSSQAKAVYVPPAPGQSSADIPDRLGTSDIMSVVLQNKPAIVKCVNEQKSKDPGTTGKLVMRWSIRPNGRTSNVSVQTAEFKSTYVATCIGGLIKNWKFPAHKVQGEPVDFPFTF